MKCVCVFTNVWGWICRNVCWTIKTSFAHFLWRLKRKHWCHVKMNLFSVIMEPVLWILSFDLTMSSCCLFLLLYNDVTVQWKIVVTKKKKKKYIFVNHLYKLHSFIRTWLFVHTYPIFQFKLFICLINIFGKDTDKIQFYKFHKSHCCLITYPFLKVHFFQSISLKKVSPGH